MSFIQLNTYAKINLSLDITGVRKDGYHEVSMVMQAVDLSDVLSVEPVSYTHLDVYKRQEFPLSMWLPARITMTQWSGPWRTV